MATLDVMRSSACMRVKREVAAEAGGGGVGVGVEKRDMRGSNGEGIGGKDAWGRREW